MNFLRWLTFERQQKGLLCEIVSSDTILPVYYFDDTPLLRNIVQCCTLRFKEILDPEMLQSSLSRLIEREGWRKLGGRIRLNKEQKLEIHVPHLFTEDRPAVNFNHEEFHVSIDEHQLASKLPAPTPDVLSVQSGPPDFRKLAVPSSAPVCLDDYLASDHPQLALKVVSFTDATLVSLHWPHITADAMSLRDLAMAWSLVLAGRESEIPPMLSSGDDPMATLGKDPIFQGAHILERYQVKGWRFLVWGFRFLFDLLWWRKVETRTVFLPHRVVSQLQNNTLSSFRVNVESDVTTESRVPFISEGDVVTAWMSLIAASALLPLKSPRTVGISNAFDLRSRLPSIFSVKQEEGSYVQNAVFPCWTNINACELIGKSDALGVAALKIRKSIETQTTEAQVHALARLTRVSLAKTGLPPMFGDTSSFLITASNWSKARLFEMVDFGPAIQSHSAWKDKQCTLTKNSQDVSQKIGSVSQAVKCNPVYYHVDNVSPNNMLARNAFFFACTPNGDYWVNGCFPIAVWKAIEKGIDDSYLLSQKSQC
ncbi:uncharacterized protein N7503_003578 [Penicillium pulvis]|uniref:uncharacterized protein n=1 Tax=Penicillium pulvis TaxID=1562058 RepID=UPI0025478BBD|nr:uncharacterized protein N7503_003578 [Penicillium pulvis]KAJ5805976.1 hypothetical protein N7503_003578 [Penicillium pulvis]